MTDEERKAKKRRRDHARVLARQQRLADPTRLTRFCRCCKTTKPSADFYPSCETRCRACEQAKALPHRDKRRTYCAEWRRKHPRAHSIWAQKRKQERYEYGVKWRAANQTQRRDGYRRWAKANPDRVNALIMKRCAAKKHAMPSWANLDAIRAFYSEAIRLTRETGMRHEVDHIIPLQSPLVCGLHVETNLQILTSEANKKKRNHFEVLIQSPAENDFRSIASQTCAIKSFVGVGAGVGSADALGVGGALSEPSKSMGQF